MARRPPLDFGLYSGVGVADLSGEESTAREEESGRRHVCRSHKSPGSYVVYRIRDITAPESKLKNAQEFLAHAHFDPGATRIPLGAIQELRGKAERWCLCNES